MILTIIKWAIAIAIIVFVYFFIWVLLRSSKQREEDWETKKDNFGIGA